MSNPVEILAAAIDKKPHSFQFIREATGLSLTDKQFASLVRSERGRFKLLRFKKWDDEGVQIRPGRPGVGLREQPLG